MATSETIRIKDVMSGDVHEIPASAPCVSRQRAHGDAQALTGDEPGAVISLGAAVESGDREVYLLDEGTAGYSDGPYWPLARIVGA